MRRERSAQLFEAAQRVLPGGVNSPVRAFRAVGGTPFFVARARGSRVWDVDGNAYIDYVGSWGPLILGHAHPEVVAALQEACERGTSYGAPTAVETELAELVREAVPSVELVRMVNSGTEAAMAAIRLARAFTGREEVIKFEGCYHGHADGLLVRAGSGATTLGVPNSAGVPADYARHTLNLPFNDADAVADALRRHQGQVACVIVEPVAGNMGLVPPEPGYLEALRRLTEEAGSLLIFDEVMTGFRVAWGGAQALYGVRPDLTCLGKVIGGGLPVGAYGGRRDVMEGVAPLGPAYQAGTLSGNPLAMTAGVVTLRVLRREGTYGRLDALTERLVAGLREAAEAAGEAGVAAQTLRAGSMFCTFFAEGPVRDYAAARRADVARHARFFSAMLERGVSLAPSQFEVGFVSLAHTEEDVDQTVAAAREALALL
ncbi:MAG: glutamate-1-semialdehyde 2,1-aminomutase [Nitrospinota bacterium]